LSYTRFSYSNLRISAEKVKAGASLRVTVEVQNTGSLAGDEVAQLYLTANSASVPVPIRSLAGIKRFSLGPGKKETISFTLRPEQMSIINNGGKRVVEPGSFVISIGGKQPGFTGHADAHTTGVVKGSFEVVGKSIEIPEK
jgi:beta-glucosidase